METGEDEAKNGKPSETGIDEAPSAPAEAEAGQQSVDRPSHADVPFHTGPDLISDERLSSAAAPFLYMLAIALVAVAGYFVYVFLRG